MKNLNQSVEILDAIFKNKTKKNPVYSRRAFARDLNLSPSFLTNFFKGRRRMSVERAKEIVKLLALDKKHAQRFLKLVLMENMAAQHGSTAGDLLDDTTSLDVQEIPLDQFQFFNSWYHVAILDLVGCVDFQPKSEWIAERLGISPASAFATVDRLKRLGLLKIRRGVLVKSNAHIRIPTARNGISAVVAFHRAMIKKALEELEITDETAKTRRLVTGLTMSMSRANMGLAKEKIERFKSEMSALLTNGEADEVVQLNIQFFPLTKPR